ncbi:PTS sugar transporter subunit IIA [uncultured Enterococcus sp.]|uniref:PTS sugar transporter subunit IIA n=1 Tax=uncultured Enterococcus sp. TaxID=167972 RepID=UPI0026110291|nr:PTS sugar transporter subunit IIA [uncultured Enterococcus sp.]
MEFYEMFKEELVSINVEVDSEEQLFSYVAKKLKEGRYVKDSYLEGITKREEEFPTGLITKNLNIALPHSDPEHIREPFIYVVRINNDVTVKQMGDNQEMKVKDFFFLGIKEPSGQVGVLQSLMNLFMNDDFVKEYIEAQSQEEIFNTIKKYFK